MPSAAVPMKLPTTVWPVSEVVLTLAMATPLSFARGRLSGGRLLRAGVQIGLDICVSAAGQAP